MISQDSRRTIRFIIIFIILLIIFYLGSIFIFTAAGARSRGNERQIEQIAASRTQIKNISKFYHLDRGVSSYSLYGRTANNKQGYYLIYLTKSKHAYIYPSRKGYSEGHIRRIFRRHNSARIREVNLGWYKGRPVWEVAFTARSGSFGYELYDFKNGRSISRVDNL